MINSSRLPDHRPLFLAFISLFPITGLFLLRVSNQSNPLSTCIDSSLASAAHPARASNANPLPQKRCRFTCDRPRCMINSSRLPDHRPLFLAFISLFPITGLFLLRVSNQSNPLSTCIDSSLASAAHPARASNANPLPHPRDSRSTSGILSRAGCRQ